MVKPCGLNLEIHRRSLSRGNQVLEPFVGNKAVSSWGGCRVTQGGLGRRQGRLYVMILQTSKQEAWGPTV